MSHGLPEMELFLEAVELEGVSRDGFVERIDDHGLRRRVRDLLRAHDELGQGDPVTAAVRPSPSSRLHGVDVDGYRIVGELGRGGMGVVYDAEQRSPERRVALKTLPLGRGDTDSQRRLEREAATLAQLSHPGIAQVYGCGRASALDGLPYVVMERVVGVPLDVFCSEHRLGVRARLQLLAKVADAVGHAHDSHIVHRDLKPQNVLVQADGNPKVLDFGIARAHGGDRTQSLLTQSGQVLGTLAYMAPEHLTATAATDALDPRSDVYSLGVIGYELLAGRLPIELPDAPIASVIRRIAELEAKPLGAVVPNLRGDVELVIGKALAKDRDRRYVDASALALDLRRLVADEPVLARAPSAIYHVRKFVRRNRALCAAAAGVVLALAAGLVWALHERDLARQSQVRAEGIAETERLRARSMVRMVDLLGSLVRTTTPQENGGVPPTMTETVDRVAAEIDVYEAEDPFVRASTHLILVDVMVGRGLTAQARHHFERAEVEFARSELTGPREDVLLALARCSVARVESRLDDAQAAIEDAWSRVDQVDDPALKRSVATTLANFSAMIRLDLPRAERLIREALAETSPGTDEERSRQQVLARVLGAQDRGPEAVAAWQQVVANYREHRPGSLRLATALQNLGLLLQRLEQRDDALVLLREALDVRREVFGDTPHVELGYALDNFAGILRDEGRFEEAIALYEEAEALFRVLHDQPHLDLGICLTEYGLALQYAGQLDQGLVKLRAAVELFDELDSVPLSAHAAALEHYVGLARAMPDAAPRMEEYVAMAQRAVDLRKSIHGEGSFLVARSLEVLAATFLQAGALADAEAVARRCLDIRLDHFGESDWRTWDGAYSLWLPMAKRGELGAAADLIDRAVAAVEATLGARDGGRVELYLSQLVRVRELQGDPEGMAEAQARIDRRR